MYICLSGCLYEMFPKFCRHCISKIKARKLMNLYNQLQLDIELIIFWCISLKKFRCCSKFLISLTQRYKTKLRAVVLNTNYFTPIILKSETFIYNRDKKILHNFCMYGCNTRPVGGEVTPSEEKFFTVGIFRKSISKYSKLKIELHICDNLNQIYPFFSFLAKKF